MQNDSARKGNFLLPEPGQCDLLQRCNSEITAVGICASLRRCAMQPLWSARLLVHWGLLPQEQLPKWALHLQVVEGQRISDIS